MELRIRSRNFCGELTPQMTQKIRRTNDKDVPPRCCPDNEDDGSQRENETDERQNHNEQYQQEVSTQSIGKEEEEQMSEISKAKSRLFVDSLTKEAGRRHERNQSRTFERMQWHVTHSLWSSQNNLWHPVPREGSKSTRRATQQDQNITDQYLHCRYCTNFSPLCFTTDYTRSLTECKNMTRVGSENCTARQTSYDVQIDGSKQGMGK